MAVGSRRNGTLWLIFGLTSLTCVVQLVQGEYGSATYKGKSVGLLKPTTYMNNSGQSLRKVYIQIHS